MNARKGLVRRSSVLIIVAVALTSSACGNLRTLTSPHANSQTLTPEQAAQQAVENFMGVTTLPQGNWQQTSGVAGTRLHAAIDGVGTFDVNPADDSVTEAVLDSAITADQGGTGIAIPQSTAEATAAAFASQHFSGFNTLVERQSQLDDHGAFRNYSFIWQEKVGDAWTPTKVEVDVNPTSNTVETYSAQDIPVSIGTSPSVTESDAASAALKKAHLYAGTSGTVQEISQGLNVVVNDDSSQQLVWIYTLTVVHQGTYMGLAPGMTVVYVDANTGSATVEAS